MAEYLSFHYEEPSDLLPRGVHFPLSVNNFPAACARLLLSKAGGKPKRALDLGCAVGRATFELARRVPEVVGIDYSQSFIRAARKIQQSGKHPYRLFLEGQIRQPRVAKAPSKIDRQGVRFATGDALRLPPQLGTFDLVLAANLIDRLNQPARFLSQVLPKLVRPGGVVLLTSPYTWSTDFTPRHRWLRDSFSHVRNLLRHRFRLLHRQDLPFLLREHRRKFQYTFADATLWQRSSS